jgi:hypothetical protein
MLGISRMQAIIRHLQPINCLLMAVIPELMTIKWGMQLSKCLLTVRTVRRLFSNSFDGIFQSPLQRYIGLRFRTATVLPSRPATVSTTRDIFLFACFCVVKGSHLANASNAMTVPAQVLKSFAVKS